jgi:hypothetical protein
MIISLGPLRDVANNVFSASMTELFYNRCFHVVFLVIVERCSTAPIVDVMDGLVLAF